MHAASPGSKSWLRRCLAPQYPTCFTITRPLTYSTTNKEILSFEARSHFRQNSHFQVSIIYCTALLAVKINRSINTDGRFDRDDRMRDCDGRESWGERRRWMTISVGYGRVAAVYCVAQRSEKTIESMAMGSGAIDEPTAAAAAEVVQV